MQDSKRSIFSWALYDWANSAFATTVMAGFFPVFFASYWAVGTTAQQGTFYLGLANSIGSLLIAVFAPFVGVPSPTTAHTRNACSSSLHT